MLPDTAGQESFCRRQNLDLWVSHVELSLDEEGGLFPHGYFLQPFATQVHFGRVHNGAFEGTPGDIFAVEFQLHDVGLGLFGDEGNGVRVVSLRLRTRRNLAIVNCGKKKEIIGTRLNYSMYVRMYYTIDSYR